jgi:hypothetical protein
MMDRLAYGGEQSIGNADTAMYRAKKSVGGRMFFDALETKGNYGVLKSPVLSASTSQ